MFGRRVTIDCSFEHALNDAREEEDRIPEVPEDAASEPVAYQRCGASIARKDGFLTASAK
jgi:hypothetical protein